MIKLLEQAYNCYLVFLDKLNYGRTNQKYNLLYDAILSLKTEITEDKYQQYFANNLLCPIREKLETTETMDRIISWALDTSPTIQESFTWTEISAPNIGIYDVTTTEVSGFNFMYISIPQNVNFLISNELNMVLYDSTKPDSASGQLFSLAGTTETSKGANNNVYKKDDVFNSANVVTFRVKIY